jgi:hypothetical protein
VLHMMAGSLRRDVQRGCDLLVRESTRDQAEYLDLAIGEPARPFRRPRGVPASVAIDRVPTSSASLMRPILGPVWQGGLYFRRVFAGLRARSLRRPGRQLAPDEPGEHIRVRVSRQGTHGVYVRHASALAASAKRISSSSELGPDGNPN